MKSLSEAAIDLPWLAPSVASLTSLAKLPLPLAWPSLRTDPAMVLLVARTLGTAANRSTPLLDHELPLLDFLLQHLQHWNTGVVCWDQPGPDRVYRISMRQALLASRLAEKIGCETEHAWMGGCLAPLGWLAVTGAVPQNVMSHFSELSEQVDASAWQEKAWGHDHTAIARRLARLWRLPAWLTAIVGHLGLHVRIAERLGAEPALFQLIQLSVRLLQERDAGLKLVVGSTIEELLDALNVGAKEAETLVEAVMSAELPTLPWEAPAKQPLLADLLRLARDNRHHQDVTGSTVERLQHDLDRLQEVLVKQGADDQQRLQAMKLSSLAEFAAGAGHEINNPLAVISGQAQYALKQLQWLSGPAEEIENVGEYLEHLHAQIVPCLQKIIGQTQRIHGLLTDLMKFARPAPAKQQMVSVKKLLLDVTSSLEADARERLVALDCTLPDQDLWITADPAQVRAALSGLLRNAIEAAPPDGRASVRVEKNGCSTLHMIVEDNGQGPAPAIREHLFDPFFSGRSAGRGRGLGLPIAWRLARLQGGDLRFEGIVQGVTRFVLAIPLAAPLAGPHFANGNGRHAPEVRGQKAGNQVLSTEY